MSAVEKILDRLEGVRASAGSYRALCPAHEDREPSLSLDEADDGRALIRCHAGCSTDDVMAALGLEMRDLFEHSKNGSQRPQNDSSKPVYYDYRDESGKALYRVKRTPQKQFYPYVPDGRGGFKTGRGVMTGVRHVLYRLPELLAADRGQTVYMCEGEKDADVGAALELTTTAHQGGSNRWKREYAGFLEGRRVRILPDNDSAGCKWALKAFEDLQGVAESVEIVSLPVEDEGADLADYLGGGGTVEELERLPATDPGELRERVQPKTPEPLPAGEPEGEGQTQTEVLIECAGDAELFHNASGDTYATVQVEDHHETHPIKSKGFRRWLLKGFYVRRGKPPGNQAMQDVLGLLEARAVFDGPQKDVCIRVAEHAGNIYIDLAAEDWRIVEVTPAGWDVIPGDAAPVCFRRPRGMLPLPTPASTGENADELLRRFLNVSQDEDLRLIIAWLLAALRPTGPYPALLVQGEQGSAKSTAARFIRELVDPSAAALRTTPRNEHDLYIAADNGHVVALDNISTLQHWLSDALCRLSTGGGFSTRTLYENREEELFEGVRPIVLNGITDIATRPDLLDRSLIVTLPTISEDSRRHEKEIWEDFREARPTILAALFDALSGALGTVDDVRLERLPRMADFAVWATAAESSLGWEPGAFMSAYAGNRDEATGSALDADPVAGAVLELMAGRDKWSGTASELWGALNDQVDEDVRRTKVWPGAPNALASRMKRLAPALRGAGVEYADVRLPGGGRKRVKTLRKNIAAKDRPGRPDRPGDEEMPGNGGNRGGTFSGTILSPERIIVPENVPDETPGKLHIRDDGDGRDDDLRSFSNPPADETEYEVDEEGNAVF